MCMLCALVGSAPHVLDVSRAARHDIEMATSLRSAILRVKAGDALFSCALSNLTPGRGADCRFTLDGLTWTARVELQDPSPSCDDEVILGIVSRLLHQASSELVSQLILVRALSTINEYAQDRDFVHCVLDHYDLPTQAFDDDLFLLQSLPLDPIQQMVWDEAVRDGCWVDQIGWPFERSIRVKHEDAFWAWCEESDRDYIAVQH